MTSQKQNIITAEARREEVVCPVCAANQPKALFWTRDYVFQCSDENFLVNRCTCCGCGYLSPRPAREVMSSFYPAEYYWAWEGEAEQTDWEAIINKRRKQIAQKAKWLDDLTPGRLLDIGAQKGEFLWYMQMKGWLVEGVELDNQVPNPAKMPIHYGDFLEMELEEAQYDVVTFWAVLEHVYEPAVFVRKAAKLLKPGGRLVVLVTNLNSIQSRFYQADDYPRHLTIFTKESASRLCDDAGLQLTKTATGQEIFGASLNGGLLFLMKRLFGYGTGEALAEWRQFRDPDLFWCRWRGRDSLVVKSASRLDRLLSLPIEVILDKLGYGQTLTFSARKKN